VYESLLAALPHASFVDASGLPERVKVIKSPREVAYLRQAADFTDAGMRAALATTAEGRTDNDVAAAAYQAMISAGSEFLSIPAIVNAGRYSGISHSTHKRHRLEQGDVLFLELTVDHEIFLEAHRILAPAEQGKRHTRVPPHILDLLPHPHVPTNPNRRITGTGNCRKDESERLPMRSQGRAGQCTPSHTGGPSDALDDSDPVVSENSAPAQAARW
jgi:Metallopeptidase family M24